MIVGQSFHLLVPCIPIPIHPCFTTEAGLLFIQPGLQLLKLFTNSKLTVRLALPSGVGYQQDPRFGSSVEFGALGLQRLHPARSAGAARIAALLRIITAGGSKIVPGVCSPYRATRFGTGGIWPESVWIEFRVSIHSAHFIIPFSF